MADTLPPYFDIESLPNEMIHKILCFLRKEDLGQARLVNHRWSNLVGYYPPKHVKFVPILSQKNLKCVKQTTVTFDTIRVHDLHGNSTNHSSQITTNFGEPSTLSRSFLAVGSAKKFIFQNPPSVPNFPVRPSIPEEILSRILRLHRNSMAHLVFTRHSLWGINNLINMDGLRMENLTVLEIPDLVICELGNGRHWSRDVQILGELGKMRAPNLKKIVIDAYLEIPREKALTWHFNLYLFFANFKSSLRSLYWRDGLMILDGNYLHSDYTVLTGQFCPLTSGQVDKLREDLGQMKLEEFDGSVGQIGNSETNGFGTLAYHLLQSQTRLVTLGLESMCGTEDTNLLPPDYFHTIAKAIQKNSSTLRVFRIPEVDYMDYEFRGADIADLTIIWRSLSTCLCLEEVDMSFKIFEGLQTLPSRLSGSLKKLKLFGMLHPDLLREIEKFFPKLEHLHFVSVGHERGGIGIGVGGRTYLYGGMGSEFSKNIKSVMHNLKRMKEAICEFPREAQVDSFLPGFDVHGQDASRFCLDVKENSDTVVIKIRKS